MDYSEIVQFGGEHNSGAWVTFSEDYLASWIGSGRWPCHGLTAEEVTCVFDKHGNLVDLSTSQDSEAMAAVVGEAQAIAIAAGLLPEQLTMTKERIAATALEIVEFRGHLLKPEVATKLADLAGMDNAESASRTPSLPG